jgi:hypothetical protein
MDVDGQTNVDGWIDVNGRMDIYGRMSMDESLYTNVGVQKSMDEH